MSLRVPHEPDDTDLIISVQAGDLRAYGILYGRHRASAHNLARQLAPGSLAAQEDLVAEAFMKVLQVLLKGNELTSPFRAYLLTALRHTAYDRFRQDRRLKLVDEIATVSDRQPNTQPVLNDPAVTACERSLILHVFAQLPHRWRWVLWHTEVEGYSTTEIATFMNLTPNGAAALAYRARKGYKEAYASQYS